MITSVQAVPNSHHGKKARSLALEVSFQSRIIPLSRGQIALIDEEDYPLVCRHAWFAMPRTKSNGGQFYAATKVRLESGGRATLYMHRLIARAQPGEDVDHDRPEATLDNRKHNLSCCSHAKNMAKVRPYARPVGVSGFRGVCQEASGRFSARAKRLGKWISLGTRDTALEAALLYDAFAIAAYGSYAITNFPTQAAGQQCA